MHEFNGSASSMQNYFDYMAERLGVGRTAPGRPEVLEFTGFEHIEVGEIVMLDGGPGAAA